MTAVKNLEFLSGNPREALSTAGQNVAEASQEFESLLLGQWLKDASNSFGSVPGDEDDDAGASQIKEFAMQHLAAALTKSGGIGIAKIVEGALISSAGIRGPEPHEPHSSAAAGDTHHKELVRDGKR